MTAKPFIRLGLTALIVRVLYFIQHVSSPFFGKPLLDQHYYDLCARQLAGAGGDLIDGFRPLFYPLFLSAFYTLDLDGGIILSIIAQHALGIGMTVMVAWLTMRIFDSTKAGVVAGLLFCFSAPPLYFEGELLIASLFSFLLLSLWIVVFQALENSTSRRAISLWLVSGLVLGFATQARPNSLPLLLFFPLLTLFRLTGRRDACDTVPQASRLPAWHPLLALLGLLLIQTSFGFLNSKYSGNFSLMTQADGINFYLGNSQKADGMIPRQSKHVVYKGKYRDPIQVMAEQDYREETGATGNILQSEVSNHWKKKTLEEIQQEPLRWIRLMTLKSWLMLWNHEVPNNRSFSFAANQETPILKWLPVHWWLLLALLPWGLAAFIKKGKYELGLWSVSFIVIFSGTIVLFFVNSRFRIPLWPGLAIIGGGGATYLWSSLKSRHIPPIPIVFSVVLLLLSTINWFNIPPDPIENDLSMRAKAYYEQGQHEEALKDIHTCLEITSSNPRYHFMHGNIQLASGNNKTAISAYRNAIALEPSDPMFHNNLAIAFEKTGQTDAAVIAYREALRLHPLHRAARTNLMLLFIQIGQLDQAQRMLTQLIKEEPKDPILLCAKSIILFKETGNHETLEHAKKLNLALAEQLLATQE